MVSIRVTKEGRQFLWLMGSALCVCSLEYYGYYRYLPAATRREFLRTQLPDLPQYAESIVVDTGTKQFAFSHKGGSQAMESVIEDVYNNSRFRRVLGLQFASAYALGLAILKKKTRLRPAVSVLALGNVLYLLPSLQTSVNLYGLGTLVAEGNDEVWENLNEIRFVQRVDEARVPLLRWGELFGVAATAVSGFYLAPFVTTVITAALMAYFHSAVEGRHLPKKQSFK